MVTGIGGTGVLTAGAIMGMAAHLEGKHCAILDSTGLAQKGGEVLSHVRLAPHLDELRTAHIITGGTDLLLACDIVSAAGKAAHETLNKTKTAAIVNLDNTPVAAFVTNNAVEFHQDELKQNITASTRAQSFIDANAITGTLLGDEMPTNIFMVGFAWQKGLVPLSFEALMRALELNGVAIESNKKAFAYGRLAAHDPAKIEAILAGVLGGVQQEKFSETLEALVDKRTAYLTDYQDTAYARRYTDMVQRIRDFEEALTIKNPKKKAMNGNMPHELDSPNAAPGNFGLPLTEAVARNYHKLLAYKDEYEVARLYTNGDFLKTLNKQFTGNYKLKFNLAPPIMERDHPATGRPKKRQFGPWMMQGFKILARMKTLRGTPLDIFGYHKDRVAERALIREYEQTVDLVLGQASVDNLALCTEILSLPDMIRGYGPVKEASIRKARVREMQLKTKLINKAEPGRKVA